MFYQIEISTHCNFECFYCAGRDMKQAHMPWDRFVSILSRLPAGPHVVSLQGEGEPTGHPRFWDMVEAVRDRALVPYTITNGTHHDPERFNAAFQHVAVSLDTLDPEEAARIGRYKLHRVLANLDALTEAMGAARIRIMTVDYGQPLADLRAFVAARGYAHTIQPLQPKHDYARRYAARIASPEPVYTHRCGFLEQPVMRYYDIEGREYPCCFIKDANLHEPIRIMREKLARSEVPPACRGCLHILTPASRPRIIAERSLQHG